MTLHGGPIEFAKLTSELQATRPITDIEMTSLCSAPGESWFLQFGCQPDNLLAIADYTRDDYNLYVRSGASMTVFTAVPPISSDSFTQVRSTDYFTNGAGITNS